MISHDNCVARAEELEAKALTAVLGTLQDEYRQLAAQWRVLADLAAAEERTIGQPPAGPVVP